MIIKQIRTFVPSKDFNQSKQFYSALGFEKQWEDKDLAIFGSKTQNFFVQNYYAKEWAENMMLQLFVEDIEKTYVVFEKVSKEFNVKIKPIFTADYGRTFHLLGPAGELWHITEV